MPAAATQHFGLNYSVPPPGSTTDVNAEHGSVDNGGPIDRVCASWVDAHTSDGQTIIGLEHSGFNQWSYENFGVPVFAPSLLGSMQSWALTVFGALSCAYHGYARSGGKPLPALGWGLLGSMFPLPTLTTALVMGYGKQKRTVRA